MTLRREQMELLTECINIGMGQAASILHDMIQNPIRLQVPSVLILGSGEATRLLEEMGSEDMSAVNMKFGGLFNGNVSLVFPRPSAVTLVNLLFNGGPPSLDMDALKSGALTEVGNILLNSVMGSIINLMQAHLNFSVPSYLEDCPESIVRAMAQTGADTHLIMARTNFSVERNAVDGCVLIVFEISFLSTLGEALDRVLQS